MPLQNIIVMLTPDQISIDRENRQRREVLVDDHFLASIKQRGILSPLLVEWRQDSNSYWLVCGERRFTAAKQLSLPEIPCRICQDLTAIELQIYEFEENAKREDLCWQDSIRSIAKVHELHLALDPDWTQAETGSVVAITQSYLSLVLRVNSQLDDERVSSCSTVREAYNVIKRREDRAAASDLEELLTPPSANVVELLRPSVTHDEFEELLGSRLPEGGGVVPLINPTNPTRHNFIPATATAPSATPESILHCEFGDWLGSYVGPKFNFIHCDFPYGVDVFGGGQGGYGKTARDGHEYNDEASSYFTLLNLLLRNLDKIMSLSGHIMLWYSETHGPKTRELFNDLAPSLDLWKFPLIWLKSDGYGIASDPQRKPKHVYETCLVASRGDRRIARVTNDAYASPTDRKLHPSTKPEPMLRHFMGMFVDETTNLLDPTCGSGSALRAAESLGAKSVLGLERDEQYVIPARQALRNSRLLKGL